MSRLSGKVSFAVACFSFAVAITAVPGVADARSGRGHHFHRQFHFEHGPVFHRHRHRWRRPYHFEPHVYVIRKKRRVPLKEAPPKPEAEADVTSMPTTMAPAMPMIAVMACDDSGVHMAAAELAAR